MKTGYSIVRGQVKLRMAECLYRVMREIIMYHVLCPVLFTQTFTSRGVTELCTLIPLIAFRLAYDQCRVMEVGV